MDKALLFREDGSHIVVSAREVYEGKYSKYEQFVDIKYPEYRVAFVSGGKPHKGESVGIRFCRAIFASNKDISGWPRSHFFFTSQPIHVILTASKHLMHFGFSGLSPNYPICLL